MEKSLIIILAFFMGNLAQSKASEAKQIAKVEMMKKLKFTIGKNMAVVTLFDTPASRDFLGQLPLTLTFKDFALKEKISYLPKKLPIKKNPSDVVPREGDFAYYSPWGNIAIFYKNIEPATDDLLILGRFDSGKEFFNTSASFEAKVRVAE